MRLFAWVLVSSVLHLVLFLPAGTASHSGERPATRPMELAFVLTPPVAREAPPVTRPSVARAPARTRASAPVVAAPALAEVGAGVAVTPGVAAALLFALPLAGPAGAMQVTGEPVRAPRFIEARLQAMPPVTYPEAARLEGIEGVVRLWVEVDASGAVTQVHVRDTPDVSLGEAARNALARARFVPAERGGRKTSTAFEYVYRFELRD